MSILPQEYLYKQMFSLQMCIRDINKGTAVSGRVSRGKRALSANQIIFFFKRGIWQRGTVSFRQDPWVYMAQRLYMVFKGLFVENHWGYAAQLTFNTMMAIVPVFAVIFAVGRGFGFEDYISEWVRRMFASQPYVCLLYTSRCV